MSKKTWILISCLVLSLTLGLGGSLAYLTDTDAKVNTFTMGDVKIEVEETFGKDTDFEEDIRPGAEVNKDAWIHNTGVNDAYVWMTVSVPSELDDVITLNWTDDAKWPKGEIDSVAKNVKGENDKLYTVYTVLVDKVLAAGDKTPILLDSVTMASNVDYDVDEKKYYLINGGVSTAINYDLHKFDVIVKGYAIQAEGFETVEEAYASFNAQWGDQLVETGAAPWDGTNADISWYDAEKETFEISTDRQLAGLAKLVNAGNNFEYKTITLTADIDLHGHEWTPIGYYNDVKANGRTFAGIFDGNNHTITGLNVVSAGEGNYGTGLFGELKKEHGTASAVLKNIIVDGATVNGEKYVGVICGYSYGLIENCNVMNAEVVCTAKRAGSIAGFTGGIIRNCTAENVMITAPEAAGEIAGTSVEGATVENNTAINVTVNVAQ